MNEPATNRSCVLLSLAILLFLPGCSSRASRAQAAFDKYQTASASGDVHATRDALLALVAAKEDVPAYWVELGKVQYGLKEYSQAYNAFTRANELNHGDADVLRYLVRIALQSGDLQTADDRSKDLDLVAPGDPMVKMTGGLISLRRGDFAAANDQADKILAANPFDGNGKVIKARALLGLGKEPEALTILEQQVAQQPSDAISLKALFNLRRKSGDWGRTAALGQRLLTIVPEDEQIRLETIQAALQAGLIPAAQEMSLPLFKPDAPPAKIDAILSLWHQYAPSSSALALARPLAVSAGQAQKVAYGRFFNSAGAPADAVSLLRDQASGSATPKNVDAQAAYYDGMAKLGRVPEAQAGLLAILAVDADNANALGPLVQVLLRLGNKPQAIIDARKLVAVEPADPEGRLLLAQSYEAAGDLPSTKRSLWEGFHYIPTSKQIYTTLRLHLTNDPEGTRQLDAEYAAERERQIMQESF